MSSEEEARKAVIRQVLRRTFRAGQFDALKDAEDEAFNDLTTAIEQRVLAQQPCYELLQRLLGWDHFDGAADGPYWRREIEKVLTARAAQTPVEQGNAQETSG